MFQLRSVTILKTLLFFALASNLIWATPSSCADKPVARAKPLEKTPEQWFSLFSSQLTLKKKFKLLEDAKACSTENPETPWGWIPQIIVDNYHETFKQKAIQILTSLLTPERHIEPSMLDALRSLSKETVFDRPSRLALESMLFLRKYENKQISNSELLAQLDMNVDDPLFPMRLVDALSSVHLMKESELRVLSKKIESLKAEKSPLVLIALNILKDKLDWKMLDYFTDASRMREIAATILLFQEEDMTNMGIKGRPLNLMVDPIGGYSKDTLVMLSAIISCLAYPETMVGKVPKKTLAEIDPSVLRRNIESEDVDQNSLKKIVLVMQDYLPKKQILHEDNIRNLEHFSIKDTKGQTLKQELETKEMLPAYQRLDPNQDLAALRKYLRHLPSGIPSNEQEVSALQELSIHEDSVTRGYAIKILESSAFADSVIANLELESVDEKNQHPVITILSVFSRNPSDFLDLVKFLESSDLQKQGSFESTAKKLRDVFLEKSTTSLTQEELAFLRQRFIDPKYSLRNFIHEYLGKSTFSNIYFERLKKEVAAQGPGKKHAVPATIKFFQYSSDLTPILLKHLELSGGEEFTQINHFMRSWDITKIPPSDPWWLVFKASLIDLLRASVDKRDVNVMSLVLLSRMIEHKVDVSDIPEQAIRALVKYRDFVGEKFQKPLDERYTFFAARMEDSQSLVIPKPAAGVFSLATADSTKTQTKINTFSKLFLLWDQLPDNAKKIATQSIIKLSNHTALSTSQKDELERLIKEHHEKLSPWTTGAAPEVSKKNCAHSMTSKI